MCIFTISWIYLQKCIYFLNIHSSPRENVVQKPNISKYVFTITISYTVITFWKRRHLPMYGYCARKIQYVKNVQKRPHIVSFWLISGDYMIMWQAGVTPISVFWNATFCRGICLWLNRYTWKRQAWLSSASKHLCLYLWII